MRKLTFDHYYNHLIGKHTQFVEYHGRPRIVLRPQIAPPWFPEKEKKTRRVFYSINTETMSVRIGAVGNGSRTKWRYLSRKSAQYKATLAAISYLKMVGRSSTDYIVITSYSYDG